MEAAASLRREREETSEARHGNAWRSTALAVLSSLLLLFALLHSPCSLLQQLIEPSLSNDMYSALPTSSSNLPPSSQTARFSLPLPWPSRHNSAAPADFSSSSSSYHTPSFLQALTARPLRVVAWAVLFAISLLIFAGGVGHGPATAQVQRIGSYASDAFWASRSSASSAWRELPRNEGLLDPVLEKDEDTGLLMPADVYPAALNP